jgi:aminobenzoyl-glutamate utilization protein B
MTAATWVPGTPAHSWQAVACGGMSIGFKGMMIAAKTLALTAVDLIDNPAILIDAKK